MLVGSVTIGRIRRYAAGATWAEVANADGVSPSAARQSVMNAIARAIRVAGFYGDRDSYLAMRAPGLRDRARAALQFLEDREPIYRRERRASRAEHGQRSSPTRSDA